MENQKAISAKIDSYLLKEVDDECYQYGIKRNRAINNALTLWLRHRDQERRDSYDRSCGKVPGPQDAQQGEKYILSLIGGHVKRRLLHMTSQTHDDIEMLVKMAIEMLLDDYDKRPFTYL